MSCPIKIKTLDYLREKGALSEKREVVDLTLFNKYNDELTTLAYDKYMVGDNKTKLFTTQSVSVPLLDGSRRYIIRATPNENLFNLLDESYNSLPIFESKRNEVYNPTEDEKFFGFDMEDLDVLSEEEKVIYNSNLDIYDTPKLGTGIAEFILFNGDEKNKYTATEVLDNIINNYSGFTKDAKDLIEKAKFLLEVTKAKVVIAPAALKASMYTFMDYNPNSNTINIYPDVLSESTAEDAVQTFLHEVVHSVTVRAYLNPITLDQNLFKTFIDEIYNKYYNSEFKDYGFTNQLEFIAEIYTNPEFQNKIKSLNNNLWNKIINYIRRLLGLRENSDYNKIIDAIVKIAPTDQEVEYAFKYEKKIDPETIKVKTSTLQEKVDHSINRILLSIDQNISKTKYFSESIKDETIVKGMKAYLTRLQALRDDVKGYSILSKAKSILTFVEFMKVNIDILDSKINDIDSSDKEAVKDIVRLNSEYLKSYAVITELQDVIADMRQDRNQKIFTKEDLDGVRKEIDIAASKYAGISKLIYSMEKDAMKYTLNNIKYFPDLEKKHINRLTKEHSQSKIPENKNTWINKQMLNRDKELIQKDLDELINNIIESPGYDVYKNDVLFSSAINVSSPLIQIMNQMLAEITNKRIETERVKDREFIELFTKLVKEKGTNNINDLYKNILDFDSNGKPFLIGDIKSSFYSDVYLKAKNISTEFNEKIITIQRSLGDIMEKYGRNSKEVSDKLKEIKKLKENKRDTLRKLEKDNYVYDSKGKIIDVQNKWKNTKKLSPIEQEVVDFFKDINDTSSKITFGKKSLIKYVKKIGDDWIKFYELPKITKKDTERLWTGNFKGVIDDKIKDLTEVRPDDIGYVEENVDLANNEIRKLRIHYRDTTGNFKDSEQSLDLFNIMRLEYKNTNMYKIRRDAELDLNYLVDIAKQKQYYQKKGTRTIIDRATGKAKVVEGSNSGTYKMMTNIMENRFYDIMVKSNTKLSSVDLNKAVGFINSASAFLNLSLNFASGTANVVNASAQLFLESFIKGRTITANGIKKANAIYAENMASNIKDITNPINESFVNQLNDYFNTEGLLNITNSNFLQSDLIKKGLSRQSLQVFQASGEHWVQSVINMSVLDGVKVMNEKSEFIDKNGNKTTEDKAASLLDMFKKNPSTGLIELDKNVVYTTSSRMSKWNEGGKEKIDALIRKKMDDTIGNYTEIDQPEYMRHWLGKLAGLYRKYLIPMGQSRLRGIETSLKREENLTEDEKRFSYALQEYEEGVYVTLIRYISTAIRDKKYYLLSKDNWNELNDYQKHNIKRAVTELVLAFVMLPLSTMLLLAGDDDEEYKFFIAYQLRRLDTELSQYRSIPEMFKIMRSPIPSARLLETAGSIVSDVFQPWTWDDTYEAGTNKGENKFQVRVSKQIPVIKEFYRTYEDLYSYQNSKVGTGL